MRIFGVTLNKFGYVYSFHGDRILARWPWSKGANYMSYGLNNKDFNTLDEYLLHRKQLWRLISKKRKIERERILRETTS